MTQQSIWTLVSPAFEEFPRLEKDVHVDVAIIGAGITGLTTALNLVGKDISVAVIDANSVGSGTTGNSTGNLYVLVQPYYKEIAAKYDLEITKTIAQSRKLAIDFIETTVNTHHIDCNFSRRPTYLFTKLKKHTAFLEKETEILKKCDIEIEKINELPIPINVKYCARLDNQGRCNPLKYVRGLSSVVQKNGGLIFENSPVLAIEQGKICKIKTEKATIFAKKVIIATHSSKGIDKFTFVLGPYRSYVVGAKLKGGKYPNGHFWDYDAFISSTHASKSQDLDIFLIAGGHHKTGQAPHHNNKEEIAALKSYLHKYLEVEEIEYHWSAQHYQAADDVPYIGLYKSRANNIYHATGYFADGLVYGTVAGILMADLILNQKNPWVDIYNPNRINALKSAKKVLKENSNNFLQYLKDFPRNVTAKDFKDIKKGEGKTIEIRGEKYGVYRDEHDRLHVVSVVCTHMKCILNWNNVEATWDCPCHGSRFSVDGDVIEGPALSSLKQFNIDRK